MCALALAERQGPYVRWSACVGGGPGPTALCSEPLRFASPARGKGERVINARHDVHFIEARDLRAVLRGTTKAPVSRFV